ncbi:MAG: SgcJ/EcaC family oxidoreductase [Acidobacteriaceae bacterium]|jgi:uncharacterized protein (TIGR02246 family)
MKKRALLLVFVVTLVASSRAQTSAETAIRHLLDRQTTDWNRGDVDAFMRGYEDSPNTTFVGQTVQYGYATIRDRYKKLYTTPAAMGKLTFSHLAIRMLDANYATATGNFHLERTTAGGGNADGIFSLLLKKDAQGWKIILDHSSRTS